MMSLTIFRRKLRQIDDRILYLLSRRMKLAAQIGLYKKKNGIAIEQKAEERRSIQDKARRAVQLGVEPKLIRQVYPFIFGASKSVQRKIYYKK